jgi:hypothetical protein
MRGPEQLCATRTAPRHCLRGLADVVDGMDRAFGEPRVEDRERIARLKLGARATVRENQKPGYAVPLQLRVPLPALERRANIFLQFDSVANESAIEEDQPDREPRCPPRCLRHFRPVENGAAECLGRWAGPAPAFPALEWRPDGPPAVDNRSTI